MSTIKPSRFRIRRTSTGRWQVTSGTNGTPWTCNTWGEAIRSVDLVRESHRQASLSRLGAVVWAAMAGESR